MLYAENCGFFNVDPDLQMMEKISGYFGYFGYSGDFWGVEMKRIGDRDSEIDIWRWMEMDGVGVFVKENNV